MYRSGFHATRVTRRILIRYKSLCSSALVFPPYMPMGLNFSRVGGGRGSPGYRF